MKGGLALAIVGLWIVLQTAKGPLAEKLGLIAPPAAPPNSNPPPQVSGPPAARGGNAVPGPGGSNTGNP